MISFRHRPAVSRRPAPDTKVAFTCVTSMFGNCRKMPASVPPEVDEPSCPDVREPFVGRQRRVDVHDHIPAIRRNGPPSRSASRRCSTPRVVSVVAVVTPPRMPPVELICWLKFGDVTLCSRVIRMVAVCPLNSGVTRGRRHRHRAGVHSASPAGTGSTGSCPAPSRTFPACSTHRYPGSSTGWSRGSRPTAPAAAVFAPLPARPCC